MAFELGVVVAAWVLLLVIAYCRGRMDEKSEREPEQRCSHAGTICTNADGSSFCGNCGEQLTEAGDGPWPKQ